MHTLALSMHFSTFQQVHVLRIPIKTWFESTVGRVSQSAFITDNARFERNIECKICIGDASATDPRAVTVSSAVRAQLACL